MNSGKHATLREHVRTIVDELRGDSANMDIVTEEDSERWRSVIKARVDADVAPLTPVERESLLQDILDEVLGFGPLSPLLRDPTIGNIYVNRFDAIYVQRQNNQLERSSMSFDDNSHFRHTIDKLLRPMGLHLDLSNPMVNAKLPNGSSIVATFPPVSPAGPTLTVNASVQRKLTFELLLTKNVLSVQMVEVLTACIKGRINIVISGDTPESGRIALLQTFPEHFGPQERVITIEESEPITLQHEHWVRLAGHSAHDDTADHRGMLLRTALVMGPDRLMLGECLAENTFDFLNAIDGGFRGSLCTINASSSRDCLRRLQSMVRMHQVHLSPQEASQLISSTLQLVVHIERMEDGARRVTEIAEIGEVGADGSISLNYLFKVGKKVFRNDGFFQVHYTSSGIEPKFINQLNKAQVIFNPEWLTLDSEV